jgi:RNA polymerase sigma factor (sigma-70 family)
LENLSECAQNSTGRGHYLVAVRIDSRRARSISGIASGDDGPLPSATEVFAGSCRLPNGPAMTGNQSQRTVEATRMVDVPEFAAQSRDEPTDDELIKRYHSARDDAAFALLVKRYAPLVSRVCCRILRNPQDAEDAFQATFVVLLRRAGSVRWQKSIAGWLYEVSHRVATKSRAAVARRTAGAGQEILATLSAPVRDDPEADRRLIVDEEIARLPESLRVPVVMCYLQGLTNAQAARRIGCREGTVVSRLARAREKLRRRLKARGVAMIGGAALAGWLAEGVSAAVAPRLLENAAALTTLPAKGSTSAIVSSHAAQLARDVARQLAGQKLLQLAAAITLGTAVVTSVLIYERGLRATAGGPGAPPTAANAVMVLNPFDELAPQEKAALGALQGDWALQRWTRTGQDLPVDPALQRIRFNGNQCVVSNVIGDPPGLVEGYVVLDPAERGKFLDLLVFLKNQPTQMRCLYEVSDAKLRLAIAPPASARPTELTPQRGRANTGHVFCVFKRLPPADVRDAPSE